MPRWTPEARLKQAERIRQWSPWSKSTGPRTLEGKSRSKTNAWKGGVRWQARGYAEIIRLWERSTAARDHYRKVISSFGGKRERSDAQTVSRRTNRSPSSRLNDPRPLSGGGWRGMASGTAHLKMLLTKFGT